MQHLTILLDRSLLLSSIAACGIAVDTKRRTDLKGGKTIVSFSNYVAVLRDVFTYSATILLKGHRNNNIIIAIIVEKQDCPESGRGDSKTSKCLHAYLCIIVIDNEKNKQLKWQNHKVELMTFGFMTYVTSMIDMFPCWLRFAKNHHCV